MLEEAREDHKENDAANLRRKCEWFSEVDETMRALVDKLIEMGRLLRVVLYNETASAVFGVQHFERLCSSSENHFFPGNLSHISCGWTCKIISDELNSWIPCVENTGLKGQESSRKRGDT
jgi:hypothetical protein